MRKGSFLGLLIGTLLVVALGLIAYNYRAEISDWWTSITNKEEPADDKEDPIDGEKVEVKFVINQHPEYSTFPDNENYTYTYLIQPETNFREIKTYTMTVNSGEVVEVPLTYSNNSVAKNTFLGWYANPLPDLQNEEPISTAVNFGQKVTKDSVFYGISGMQGMTAEEQIFLTVDAPGYPFLNFDCSVSFNTDNCITYYNGMVSRKTILEVSRYIDTRVGFTCNVDGYSYKLTVDGQTYESNFGDEDVFRFESNTEITFDLINSQTVTVPYQVNLEIDSPVEDLNTASVEYAVEDGQTKATCTATASEGYVFTGWYENDI